MVGLLQAVPGTKLHARLHQQGRLIGHTTGDNVDDTTNFVSRTNRETLRDGYRRRCTISIRQVRITGGSVRFCASFARRMAPAP